MKIDDDINSAAESRINNNKDRESNEDNTLSIANNSNTNVNSGSTSKVEEEGDIEDSEDETFVERAEEMLVFMHENHITPSEANYQKLLFLHRRNMQRCDELVEDMRRHNVEHNAAINNTLIVAYFLQQRYLEVVRTYQAMRTKGHELEGQNHRRILESMKNDRAEVLPVLISLHHKSVKQLDMLLPDILHQQTSLRLEAQDYFTLLMAYASENNLSTCKKVVEHMNTLGVALTKEMCEKILEHCGDGDTFEEWKKIFSSFYVPHNNVINSTES